MMYTTAPQPRSHTSVTSRPAALLVLLCCWFLCAAPSLCTAASDALEEDVLFDKAACQAGLHKMKVDEELQAPDIFNVRWKTTAAEEGLVVQVYRDWAPLGADHFYQLILDNYYNCAAFFRVVPDFVIQFGIASEPDESTKWSNTILDDPVTQSNERGIITYATGGANTRTTQLFIILKDNSGLDQQGFAPFGKVVSGMDVLQAIFNPTPNASGGASQSQYESRGNEWILQTYPEIDLIENTALFEGEVNSEKGVEKVILGSSRARALPACLEGITLLASVVAAIL